MLIIADYCQIWQTVHRLIEAEQSVEFWLSNCVYQDFWSTDLLGNQLRIICLFFRHLFDKIKSRMHLNELLSKLNELKFKLLQIEMDFFY